MGAKDELIEAFVQDNWRNPLFSLEKCKAWVDRRLDVYAHELAEKLRVAASEEIDKQGERTSPSDSKYDIAAGMVKAANLIDPGGCREASN